MHAFGLTAIAADMPKRPVHLLLAVERIAKQNLKKKGLAKLVRSRMRSASKDSSKNVERSVSKSSSKRVVVVASPDSKTDFEKLKGKVKEAKAMARELENQQNHILGLYQTASFAEANLERMKEKSPRLFPEFIPAEDHEETKPNPWDEKTNTRWEE